jgi:hypothetical protein
MRYLLLTVVMLGLLLGTAGAWSSATNISGTWTYSVDIGRGMNPNGTLTFKQEGEKLTGTYAAGMGEHKFTGTLKGDKVEFSFDKTFTGDSRPTKITHTGTVESATKMAGTFDGPKGTVNWTATKK